jgi:hypothetical protein
VVSLAPILFPTTLGFPLLVANDPASFLGPGNFSFNEDYRQPTPPFFAVLFVDREKKSGLCVSKNSLFSAK